MRPASQKDAALGALSLVLVLWIAGNILSSIPVLLGSGFLLPETIFVIAMSGACVFGVLYSVSLLTGHYRRDDNTFDRTFQVVSIPLLVLLIVGLFLVLVG